MTITVYYHGSNLAADRTCNDDLNAKATEAMERWRAGRSHLLQRIVSSKRNAAGREFRVFEYIEVSANGRRSNK